MKTALITGAANGIGAAVARELLSMDAALLLMDVDDYGLKILA
jgi:NAD(P)-dependent dehydrogenase (short-subunit alcohol dehydrogenase family)